MNIDKLTLDLKERALASESLAIGLDQYEEVLLSINYVISNASEDFKILFNDKDPTHKSIISEFFDNKILITTLKHVNTMGVHGQIFSVHSKCNIPAFYDTSQVIFNEEIRKLIIKLQADSEFIINDRGDCVLFTKYRNNKKLPKNEYIKLFSVDEELTNTIGEFFKSLMTHLKGKQHG